MKDKNKKMKVTPTNEFPASIAETSKLIEQLDCQVQAEKDRDQRRELFLWQLELKAHLADLKVKRNSPKRKK